MAVVHRTIAAQMNAVLFNFKRISATQLENVRHRKYAVALASRIAYYVLWVFSTRLRCDLEDILLTHYLQKSTEMMPLSSPKSHRF